MIGVLDYGFGNIQSVLNSLNYLGFDGALVGKASDFSELTHLIVPGVGAFDAAMEEIHRRELFEPVVAFARSGRPLLGICLGMQLLASYGQENRGGQGFNLIPGKVIRLDSERTPIIPHCGWNSVDFKGPHALTEGLKKSTDFYFVHSYHFRCDEPQIHSFGVTNSGEAFTSVVVKDNVVGVQFHPEKSQGNGLKILENFSVWDGSC